MVSRTAPACFVVLQAFESSSSPACLLLTHPLHVKGFSSNLGWWIVVLSLILLIYFCFCFQILALFDRSLMLLSYLNYHAMMQSKPFLLLLLHTVPYSLLCLSPFGVIMFSGCMFTCTCVHPSHCCKHDIARWPWENFVSYSKHKSQIGPKDDQKLLGFWWPVVKVLVLWLLKFIW